MFAFASIIYHIGSVFRFLKYNISLRWGFLKCIIKFIGEIEKEHLLGTTS